MSYNDKWYCKKIEVLMVAVSRAHSYDKALSINNEKEIVFVNIWRILLYYPGNRKN